MSIRSFFVDEEFKLIYLPQQIDIINYQEIISFDEETIRIQYRDGTLIVSGSHLVISKLLVDEVLIEGEISKIEFR